jgi:pimeloyl-ACP methyl ester carboxylesterase
MTATTPTPRQYVACANSVVQAANGISYAYREVGEGTPPLVVLQYFRGNLDNLDPALIDTLASARRVVTFDNAGVGGSTGSTPSTVTQMAIDAIAFLDAMDFVEVDVLGFSIGSFVAQEIALLRPGAVRRLALASSAPRGRRGCTVGPPESSRRSAALPLIQTATSACSSRARRQAGRRGWETLERITARGGGTETSQRHGKLARRSTMRSARGESPITACYSGSAPSTYLSSSRTATATR